MSSPAPTEAETDPVLDALVPGTFFRFIPKTGPEGFRMGRRGGQTDEEPVHNVVIGHDFYMADIPVTQQQFREWTSSAEYTEWFDANGDRIEGGEPHRNEFEGDDLPAESVTWYEAKAFCDWLNQKHRTTLAERGLLFRLPTEAEWEYACRLRRDGSIAETDYWFGDGEEALARIGWYDSNSGGRTHPVRSSPHQEGGRHPMGLHGLHGNVAEWCEDYYFSRQYCYSEALDHNPCQATPVEELTDSHRFWQRVAEVFREFKNNQTVTAEGRSVFKLLVSSYEKTPDPFWKKVINGCREALGAEQGTWPANELGLADLLAAYAERYSTASIQRVMRGGSWIFTAVWCRAAFRSRRHPLVRFRNQGFRVLLWLPGPAEPSQEGGSGATGTVPSERKAEGTRPVASEAPEIPATVRVWRTVKEIPEADGVDMRVTKLVVGELGGTIACQEADALMGKIARWYPRLTHLHAWGMDGLREIRALPPELRVLDLRNCGQLERLPDLPEGLETLDLAGCGSLRSLPGKVPESLGWLHVDGCGKLVFDEEPAEHEQMNLQDFLRSCRRLREFTASGMTQITDALDLPASPLRKLVLAGCSNLSVIKPRRTWEQLEHLNVNDCGALYCLPLPASDPVPSAGQLRYLLTHGCVSLRHLGNRRANADENLLRLDLRRVHRSRHASDSTAAMLRAMMLLRMDPVKSRMAKLLFLGNGRCGKTTAAKALRWLTMKPDERKADPRCDPSKYSGPTRDIAFDRCDMRFREPGGSVESGTAHFWDFGGQEMYRNTHRIFAEAGSVFVIAVANADEHTRRIEVDHGEIAVLDRAEYEKENQYYLLSYWLDYIRSARKLMSIEDFGVAIKDQNDPLGVVIIYTGPPPNGGGQIREYLMQQAGPYRSLIEDGSISHYWVDFAGTTWERDCGGFDKKVGELLGAAADAYGIMIPRAFDRLRERCGQMVKKGTTEVLDESGWEDMVVETLEAMGSQYRGLAGEVSRGVRDYLHQCGIVFAVGATLIVDQKQTIERMYQCIAKMRGLLNGQLGEPLPDEALRKLLRRAMENGPGGGQAAAAAAADLMREMLQKCGYLQQADFLEDWAIVHPELLPEERGYIEVRANQAWRTVAADRVAWKNDSLALVGSGYAILGAHDYRRVAAWVVKHCLTLAKRWAQAAGQLDRPAAEQRAVQRSLQWIGWKDGFQMVVNAADGSTLGVIRMRWRQAPLKREVTEDAGTKGDPRVVSLTGGILLEVLSRLPDHGADWLAGVLQESSGPLAELSDHLDKTDRFHGGKHGESLRSSPRAAGQPSWREFDGMNRSKMDVAFSYRGSDSEFVGRICAVLRKRVPSIGLVFYTDTSEERRSHVFLREVYDDLRNADVLVVVASKTYFEKPDRETDANLYCPVELADAVRAFQILRTRTAQKTIVLRADTDGGKVSSQKLDEAIRRVLQQFNKIVAKRQRDNDTAGVRRYERKVFGDIFSDAESQTIINGFCSNVGSGLLADRTESDDAIAGRILKALGLGSGS